MLKTKLLILGLSLSLGGCAELLAGFTGTSTTPKGCKAGGECRTVEEVKVARKNNDFKALSEICLTKTSGTKTATKDAACIAAAEVLAEKGDVAKLQEICDGQKHKHKYQDWRKRFKACEAAGAAKSNESVKAIEEATCETLIQTFTEHKSKLTKRVLGDDKRRANLHKAGAKMAKCGHWDFIIEEMAHWGQNKSGMGYALITAMAGDGTDWPAQFLAHAKRKGGKPFAFEHAFFFLSHYFDYLVDSGKTDCKPYIAVAANVPDKPFGPFNWYFRKTGCKAAASVIAKRLGADYPKARSGACESLGLLGNKKAHLALVERLAKTDPFFWLKKKDDEGRLLAQPIKIYDVRNECALAANKLATK